MVKFTGSAVLALLLLAGCGSAGVSTQDGPGWIRQPARSVEGGYIIYVGSGEDRNPDLAKLKAEAQTVGDLANECSFAPKGARIEDRYEFKDKGVHRVYVKAAVDFQSCEEAKASTTPDDIRKLASVPMAEELKRYHELVADESEEDFEEEEEGTEGKPANPMLASTHPIQSEPQFWMFRQRVFYEKQVVILAPPTAYPPGAPQTQAVTTQLASNTQQIHTYEVANPQIHTSPKTWSGTRMQAMHKSDPTTRRLKQTNHPPRSPNEPHAKKRRKRVLR